MRKPLVLLLAVAAVVAAILAVPALAATKTVRVLDNEFRPDSLRAKRGDRVTFRWQGDNPHNVRVTRGPVRFSSGSPETSGTYRVRLRRRGTYRIVCDVHDGMDMRLRVR